MPLPSTLRGFVLRLLRLTPALLALVALGVLVPNVAQATVTVSAKPALYPAFQRDVTDYVSRCKTGKPLVLSGTATGGEKVKVGSRPAHSGQFTESLNRNAGGGITVRVTSSSRPRTFHIRCLPSDFPKWDVSRPGKPQAQWYVVTPIGTQHKGYLAVFNSRAVPVWWRYAGSYGPWDAKPMPGGTIAWTHYLGDPFGQPGASGYEEHRLDGGLVRRIRAFGVPTDTHELQRMSNGDYLVISYVPRTGVDLSPYGGPENAKVYDGVIQELTPAGTVKWEWRSNDHFDPSATGRWLPILVDRESKKPASERYYDLVHLNSVEPEGDGFVVSARHLDAVFRINHDGSIDWKLGGTNLPGKSLVVMNDPNGDPPIGGSHDARLWTDGSVTVFDNETLTGRAPRAVRYAIDPLARTATFMEEVRDSRVTQSIFGGSARKLPGGDWVVYWGGSTLVTEQTDKGAPVLSISFRNGRWGYRAAPVVPGQLSAKTLRNGMDAMSKKR